MYEKQNVASARVKTSPIPQHVHVSHTSAAVLESANTSLVSDGVDA